MKSIYKNNLKIPAFAFLTFMLVSFLTGSIVISFPISILVTLGIFNFAKQRKRAREATLTENWPEAIDHLISGLYAGRSLIESLIGLSERGPVPLQPYLKEFKKDISSGMDFQNCIERLRSKFSHHGSDQVLEALLIAKNLGGGALINLLRTVGEFQRQDLALNKEIQIKQGWIKNSAHLSAAAPWFLLLILSTQTSTVSAYSNTTGIIVLLTGFVLTVIAYIWMSYLSRLPKTPRVFANQYIELTPRVFTKQNSNSSRHIFTNQNVIQFSRSKLKSTEKKKTSKNVRNFGGN